MQTFEFKSNAQLAINWLLLQKGFVSNGLTISKELGIDTETTRQIIDFLEMKDAIKVDYISDADHYNGLPHYVKLIDDCAL